ncbi:MAG: Soluble epoxide hydrolase [Chroococcopsis gigantea SAG 12.99]|jgi:pimeloyl-ACP methyl ester carboxylesterase|nr:Soluble epoxide hydrolase [Chroococcopsis gigantea SAG 12.99]
MSLQATQWQSAFITTNGINLHYITKGRGKLILFLHGFPEFWYSWRHQMKEFGKDYHVVALDLRGYNKSDKPPAVKDYSMSQLLLDVKGTIEALGYDRCILVGHDWGGAIAWNFAYQYPRLLEKLIILNLPHPALFRKGLTTPAQLLRSWYIFFFQLPYLPELLIEFNKYQLIADAFLGMAIDKSAFTDEDIGAYKESASQPGALTAMVNYYRNIFDSGVLNGPGIDRQLDIPTLMIWGENDSALGKELTYGTEKYVPDITIKYIPDCSHWVQQEQPRLVNQYIREFLQ